MASIMPFGSKERDIQGQELVEVVASVLEELVATSNASNKKSEVTKFHGLKAPAISIPEYLQRISRFSGCSNECFVMALIYIDRLITRKRLFLDHLNVHRLVITSILLAAKFFDDHYLDNAHYAAVGGIPTHEINSLEVEFCFLAEFNFHVNCNDYDTYNSALSSKAQALKTKRNTMIPSTQQQQNVMEQDEAEQKLQQQQMEQKRVHHLPYQQPQTHGVAPIMSNKNGHQQVAANYSYSGNSGNDSNINNSSVNSNNIIYKEGVIYNGNTATPFRPEYQYQQKNIDPYSKIHVSNGSDALMWQYSDSGR